MIDTVADILWKELKDKEEVFGIGTNGKVIIVYIVKPCELPDTYYDYPVVTSYKVLPQFITDLCQ